MRRKDRRSASLLLLETRSARRGSDHERLLQERLRNSVAGERIRSLQFSSIRVSASSASGSGGLVRCQSAIHRCDREDEARHSAPGGALRQDWIPRNGHQVLAENGAWISAGRRAHRVDRGGDKPTDRKVRRQEFDSRLLLCGAARLSSSKKQL